MVQLKVTENIAPKVSRKGRPKKYFHDVIDNHHLLPEDLSEPLSYSVLFPLKHEIQ